jgi:2-dehydro-3-deoxygluconokinase
LSRLGVPVRWVGRVGNDSLGALIQRELRAEGVDVRAVVDATAPTAVMIKESRLPGSNRVSFYRAGSAGSRLQAADLDALDIATASLLLLSGISSGISASAAAAADAAVDAAVAQGVPVALDINHRASVWKDQDAPSVYRSLARRADLVFAGLDEAMLVAEGSTPEECARAIAALGAREVVIKLGGEGAMSLVGASFHRQTAVAVTAVDTVGAGDAFVAGYLAEYLRGGSATDRLTTAVRTGAFACLSSGDWEGAPRWHELALLDAAEPVSR